MIENEIEYRVETPESASLDVKNEAEDKPEHEKKKKWWRFIIDAYANLDPRFIRV